MTFHGIAVEAGKYRVFATDDGIRRTYLGHEHATPRAAIRYADNLERGMPVTQPLRAPAEPPGGLPPLAIRRLGRNPRGS